MVLVALLCSWTFVPRAEPKEILPSDVYQAVQELRLELEVIRAEMGRPQVFEPELHVRYASPWEVLSQAQAVYAKSSRLAEEFSLEQGAPPSRPIGEAKPADVHNLLSAARGKIASVGRTLKVNLRLQAVPLDRTRTPTDVFRAMLRVSRQLNQMLSHPIEPRDVFQQVSLAIAYSQSLAETLGVTRLPRLPKYASKKMPFDVLQELLECQEQLRQLALRKGLRFLQVSRKGQRSRSIVPGDVYDASILLVSQLRHLRSKLGLANNLRSHRYPGRIFPSHVFQQVAHLRLILADVLAGESPKTQARATSGTR